MSDTLEFRLLTSPYVPDGETEQAKTGGVALMVNGEDLIDTYRRIEAEHWLADDPAANGDYGRLPAAELLDLLSEALTPDSYAYECGVFSCCCPDCGMDACWSVDFRVKEDEEHVYWTDFRHENRPWRYDLSFTFDKKDYEREMKKLADIVRSGRG